MKMIDVLKILNVFPDCIAIIGLLCLNHRCLLTCDCKQLAISIEYILKGISHES
ncbi:MAG: hypothetical protein ISS13_03245 [Actinobacteria bacterium]|nr:hypothetical protein [Actinomycetota bacterium]